MKVPLLLNFKNGKRSDWRIENLQWLCYNCYFLFVDDPFTSKMLQRIESNNIEVTEVKDDVQEFYQLEDFYYDHLKRLGLEGSGDILFKPDEPEPDEDGNEFIDIRK